MSTYHITIHLNRREDAGHYTHGYRAGDPLEAIGGYDVEAGDAIAAAESIFEFGNLRTTADLNGKTYPSDQRSISKGDVLTVEAEGVEAIVLACASFGWKHLSEPVASIIPIG